MSTTVNKLQTTTVRIPKLLYEEARAAIANGVSEAKSMNDLLVASLSQKLRQLRRERIDAEFANMKDDQQHQREGMATAEGFAVSDWEALRSAEKQPK